MVNPYYILKTEDLEGRPADVESRWWLLKTPHMQETGLEWFKLNLNWKPPFYCPAFVTPRYYASWQRMEAVKSYTAAMPMNHNDPHGSTAQKEQKRRSHLAMTSSCLLRPNTHQTGEKLILGTRNLARPSEAMDLRNKPFKTYLHFHK